jgi:hypothetical protein
MLVTVKGLPANVEYKRVRHALTFYSDILMGKRMSNNIEICVSFIKDLTKTNNVIASCIWEDSNYRPRSFLIEIDASISSTRRLMTALAHEMVHVKQYAKSEMCDLFRGPHASKWNGKPVNEDDVEYWDLPWEIEAYGREQGLYERFKIYWNKNKKDILASKTVR